MTMVIPYDNYSYHFSSIATIHIPPAIPKLRIQQTAAAPSFFANSGLIFFTIGRPAAVDNIPTLRRTVCAEGRGMRAGCADRRARPAMSPHDASLANHPPVIDARWRLRHIDGANAEQAFDASDHAADRGANDGTDRACDAEALIRAMDEAAGNALSLGRERRSDGRDDNACVQHLRFHQTTPSFLLRRPQTPAQDWRFGDDGVAARE